MTIVSDRLLRTTLVSVRNIDNANIYTDNVLAYSPTKSYKVGEQSYLGQNIYKSTTDNNLGNAPSGDERPNTFWVYMGKLNPFRLHDGINSTQTISNGSGLEVIFETINLHDAIVLTNTEAKSITVTKSSGEVIKINLVAKESTGWWEFFFGKDFVTRRDKLINLGKSVNGKLILKFEAVDGAVKVGNILVGKRKFLGESLYGVTAGIMDFSNFEQDKFGNMQISPRGSAKVIDAQFIIENKNVDFVYRELAAIAGTPSAFIVDDREKSYDTYTTFGVLKEFNILFSDYQMSRGNISIRGLK